MNGEKIRWEKPFSQSYQMKRTSLIMIIVFLSITAAGMIFFVLIAEIIIIYGFLITGLFLSLFIGAIDYDSPSKFPKKIGYNSEKVYYIDSEDDLEKIHFDDIYRMTASHNLKGQIIIILKNGRVIASGPGMGGKFGRSMLEEFARWTTKNTDKHAEVNTEIQSSFPEIKRFIVEPSKKEKRNSEGINYPWFFTSIVGWIAGIGLLIYLFYSHGFDLVRDPILFSLLASVVLILWISYNASSHIRR